MATKSKSATAVQPAAPVAPAVLPKGAAAATKVQVKPGAKYNTKAAHNQQWWATLVAQATGQPVAVAVVTAAPHNVPSHFVGYCLRRGYLQAAE